MRDNGLVDIGVEATKTFEQFEPIVIAGSDRL